MLQRIRLFSKRPEGIKVVAYDDRGWDPGTVYISTREQ